MRAAPDSMLAMRLSWPGLSTKLTTRDSSEAPPQAGHFGAAEYPAGASHDGHL